MAEIKFRIRKNGGPVEEVGPDAKYNDRNGREYPALIEREYQQELVESIGHGKYRKVKYPVADLRIHNGRYSNVKHPETGMTVKRPEIVPVRGAALAGKPSSKSGASYIPNNPSKQILQGVVDEKKTKDEVIAERDRLNARLKELEAKEDDKNKGPDFDRMSQSQLEEYANSAGIDTKPGLKKKDLIEALRKAT